MTMIQRSYLVRFTYLHNSRTELAALLKQAVERERERERNPFVKTLRFVYDLFFPLLYQKLPTQMNVG
jgi:hypothetical protein